MVVGKVIATALLRVGQLVQQLDHQRMTEAELTVDVCTCTEGRDQVVGAGPKHTTAPLTHQCRGRRAGLVWLSAAAAQQSLNTTTLQVRRPYVQY